MIKSQSKQQINRGEMGRRKGICRGNNNSSSIGQGNGMEWNGIEFISLSRALLCSAFLS
jgi:hypothetical protein